MTRTPLALLFLLFAATLPAQEGDAKPAEADKPAEKKEGEPDPPVVTEHTVTIGGEEIAYTATAGTLPLVGEDEDEKADADVFFVAYTRGGVEDVSTRPVTFCFNGGPGSSSVWLHMGMLGPKIVELPSDATYPRPPYAAKDNPQSLLDVTDLVFIDPVSTGYSRPADPEKKREFHGFDEDLRSIAEFIHRYTTKYERWASPKYLLGESYGTLRAAGLAGRLSDRYNMELNGIVLVSSVLDFATLRFATNNDLPNILFLPTYAATAFYHGKLGEKYKSVEEVVKQAREFALGEYTLALMRGAGKDDRQRDKVAARFAELTGLSKDYVLRNNLRVPIFRFVKELLREEGKTVGRFDSRYTGDDRDDAGDSFEYDPSGAALFGAFTSALYQYLREDLGVEKEIPYEILTGKVQPWNYGGFEGRYVETADVLRGAMQKNPFLRVYVANGYYDLATPFAATEYTMDHVALDPALKDRITMSYFPAGHMMYVHAPSLEKLRADLVTFFAPAE